MIKSVKTLGRWVVLGCCGWLLQGCGIWFLLSGEEVKIDVKLRTIQFVDYQNEELRAIAILTITNPSQYTYPGYSLLADISLEGIKLLSVEQAGVGSLAARSSTEVGLPFSLQVSSLKEQFSSILEDGKIDYKVTGSIKIFRYSAPFSIGGSVYLPKISFSGVDFISPTELKLTTLISNTNPEIEIPLNYLEIKAYYQKSVIFSAIGPEKTSIKPLKTEKYDFIVSFKRDLWQGVILNMLRLKTDIPESFGLELEILYGGQRIQLQSPKMRLTAEQKERINKILIELY